MTCCNHDCNEGRDCPARVTKVHRRAPDADPLPPVQWRRYVRHLAAWLLVCLTVQWLFLIYILLA